MVRQPHTTTAAATTATTTTAASTTASLLLSPPKRKKGRPSLHDLQQRKLFHQHQQQQQQQHLRNNIDDDDDVDDDDDDVGDDDIDDHRRRRRRRNPNSINSIDSLPRRVRSSRRTSNLSAKFLLGSDSDTNSEPNSDSDDERSSKKVRRLSSSSSKNPQINFHISQDEKGSKAIDTHNETRMLSGPTNASTSASASATVLPDKKLLLLLLDKLQKKDTRGVFAEPVDPEELPDYHEVIEKPMDFGTVRSNLINGRYKTLEQFEEDVYLISSNAMQYNPPSTVFFRQARSIQELAKKEFEALRQDAGLSEPPSKPRRGRPPGSRNLKKLLESSPVDHAVSNSPSDTTPTPTPTLAPVPAPAPTPTPSSREDDATRSGSYNLRKGPSLYRFPRRPDNSLDYSASSSRHMSSTKYGKKPCVSEENRRDTYISSQSDDTSQDTLAAFGGSDRQLVGVSLASDNHSYARSLTRFAADLGPVVWNIVSKKLRSILPPNVNFGPGWVEETPLPDNSVQSSSLLQDPYSNNRNHSLTPGFEISTFAPKHSASCSESFTGVERSREWSSLNGINGGMTPGSIIHPPMNNFSSGLNSQFQEGLVRPTSSPFFNLSQPPKAFAVEPSAFDTPSTSAAVNNLQSPPLDYHGMMNPEIDMGTHGMQYWKNLSMQERWDQPYPPEFSGGFQASSSRNSGGLQIGSPPQLDLVLQL